MSAPETEAATVASLAKASVAPVQLTGPLPTILVFADKSIRSLEAYGDTPKRKRAQVVLHEAKSFIAYVKAHAIASVTALFGSASEDGGSFSAIIDYHGTNAAGASQGSTGLHGAPNWGEHHVQFNLQFTPEWLKWIEKDDTFMSQENFCEFIEDNMLDIVDPDGASMLEMASLISGTKGVTFKSGKNLKSGAIELGYVEEISASAKRDASMHIPDKFTLGLVPFVGALGVKMDARLRFNIGSSGQLSFKYILNRPYKVIENDFAATRDLIESETKMPVLLGNANIQNPAA